MKIWLRANFSSNIFRLIQQNFHVGLVYSLFHPTFHSYDVIWNVSTSNFKWFNKIKALCKTVTIKKSLNKAKKKKQVDQRKYTKETEKKKGWGNSPDLAFCLVVAFHHQSLQALIVSLVKICLLPSLIWHWMKEWMDLHVNETYWMTRTNDINFRPTFFQHLPKISSNMLDKMLDRFN